MAKMRARSEGTTKTKGSSTMDPRNRSNPFSGGNGAGLEAGRLVSSIISDELLLLCFSTVAGMKSRRRHLRAETRPVTAAVRQIVLITFRGLKRRQSSQPLHRQHTVQVSALPASQRTCCTGRACRSTDAHASPVFLSAVGTVAPPAIDLTSINDSEPPDRSSPIDSDLHSE